MSQQPFESILSEPIEKLIKLRQCSGSDYTSQIQLLHYFDRFLVQQRYDKTILDAAIISVYEESMVHINVRSRANRLCVVRQLCQQLYLVDTRCFIPPPSRDSSSQNSFSPYLYSTDDINDLLEAALRLPPVSSLRGATMHTLLGLLYSTGIRIGEALALNLEDFYPDTKRLYIARGKFHKARWVPLSPSTSEALNQYVARRRKVEPSSPASTFFINLRHRRFHHCTISQAFNALLKQCQITGNGCKPRLHDLRHTFAVERLLGWYQDGKDINTRLSWLSTYLGHINPLATVVYLHPTAQLMKQVNERFHRHYQKHLKHTNPPTPHHHNEGGPL
ncbi:MAG: tyrosine-type recombinase/integrase [Ketobacter sp.]|nr:tyrosine-type recombinase/integrase [Ketobacter sp.]